MIDVFISWLESNDCYEQLLHCSGQVISRARKKAINLEVIFQDAVSDSLDNLTQLVAQEMWQYLKEKSQRIAERASDKLVQGDMSGFMEVLIGMFLDHCRDKRRTYSIDPVYAYYRSIRTVLSESKIVNTQSTRRGTYYAYSFDKSLQHLPYKYWDGPYHDWAQPHFMTEDIFESSAILELARFFWVEALDRFTEAYLLPVKELSRFLNSKYQICCVIERESDGALAAAHDAEDTRTIDDIALSAYHADDFIGQGARQNPRIDIHLIRAELEKLAKDCLGTLTETERIVLVRTESGVKMLDIAHELGMKRESNVSPYKDKAYEKIRRTWSLWGPASIKQFSDIDDEEFWEFYDKVIVFCNSSDHCREA
jgi:hypothetical protein